MTYKREMTVTQTPPGKPFRSVHFGSRSAQICYRNLMRTRDSDKLFCHESKLNHNIRLTPRQNLSEDQIRETKEEQKNVEERRKKIEAAKGPTQKQLKQRREAINENATIRSKEDPIEWGTHTPAPTESEDEESEDEATKQRGTEGERDV